MGTDIHLAVEVIKNGGWTNVTPFVDDDGYLSNYPNGYFESRSYDTFAILANVRNGSGFAGCDTGEDFVPLADQRGIPDDCDVQIKQWAENGDHSQSWCTLQELLDYDWTRVTTKRGIVGSMRELGQWKLRGAPESWSGGISGPGIQVFDMNAENIAVIERIFPEIGKTARGDKFGWYHLLWTQDDEFGGNKNDTPEVTVFREKLAQRFRCDRPHFKVSWEIPYYRAATEFVGETIPKLLRLGKPEDVRLIYWFDS